MNLCVKDVSADSTGPAAGATGGGLAMQPSTCPRRTQRLRSVTAAFALLAALLAVSACSTDDNGQELSGQAAAGVALAKSYSCSSCHTTDGAKSSGPTWKDLWGSEVELSNGETVTVDADYIHRSITDPSADVVEGFNPTMPAFDLDDDELDALTAYIESLGTAP